MTANEANGLKSGDKLIDNDGRILTLQGFNSMEFKGSILLYIAQPTKCGNTQWLPYWIHEVELYDDQAPHACVCDRMNVCWYGCKCGGY